MKAYYLTIKDNEDAGTQVVFANTAREAKRMVSGNVWDNLEDYIDLRVNRASKFDGMENYTEAELALEQWKQGWQWFDLYDMPNVDEHTEADFIKWYSENFS